MNHDVNLRREFLNKHLSKVDGHQPNKRISKHVKMATDPFVFFRGSSQLFYADIKNGVLQIPSQFERVDNTAIMGDCHLSNFGFFTEEGSHGDNVIFAPNDFDDACYGPAVWDIARFIVSLILASKYGQKLSQGEIANTEPKVIGKPVVDEQQCEHALNSFIKGYVNACQQSIESDQFLKSALEHFEPEHILYKRFVKAKNRSAEGSEFFDKSQLAKAVVFRNQAVRFKHIPDKFNQVSSECYQEIKHVFAPYVNDEIVDIVSRHGAGTGSLNLSRFYLLVGPKTCLHKNDLALYHIVEIKQQRQAAPLYHFDDISPKNRLNPAHLTVQCQRHMQRNPDLVLDDVRWKNQYWLIRSRHHAKVGIDPAHIVLGKKTIKSQGFEQYATACGWALALAHCRGDRRSDRFEQQVIEALKCKEALITSCRAYAQQVQGDTESLKHMLSTDITV